MIRLDGQTLTAEQLTAITRGEAVTLDDAALAKVVENRAVIQRILDEGRVVYGIGSEATISGTRANTIHQAPDAYEPDNNLAEGAVEWRPGEDAIYSKIRAAEGDPRDMFWILPAP